MYCNANSSFKGFFYVPLGCDSVFWATQLSNRARKSSLLLIIGLRTTQPNEAYMNSKLKALISKLE